MGNPAGNIRQAVESPKRNLLGAYSYDVNLSFFSGPMDLLLHLVHRQEVPVEKVEMKLICEQYLNIVLQTAEKDLERATEYLVIAATLLSIKSSSLLPSEVLFGEDNQDPGYDVRFFEDLRARLMAYQTCKGRAEALRALPQHGVDTFSRNDRRVLIPTAEMIAEEEESINGLALAFMGLLKRIGATAQFFKIQLESVSVVHYMMRIVERLKKLHNLSFYTFLKDFSAESDKSKDLKTNIIGSFIAILELAKRGVIVAEQENEQANFKLSYRLRENEEVGELFSEFDLAEQEDSEKVIHLADYVGERGQKKEDDVGAGLRASPATKIEKQEVNRG